MEIIRRIADVHSGSIFILIFISCIYIMANFFSRFRQRKLALIVIPIFFVMVYKFIIDYLTNRVFIDYIDVLNAFFIVPLFLAPLFFIYGAFVGFKRIKNDVIVEVKKAKYLFFFSGLAVFTAPLIAIFPEDIIYWSQRSYDAACVLLAFWVSLLILPPFFYALKEALHHRKKSHKHYSQNIFYSSLYWLCLMSNILVLNTITLLFVMASFMVFIGGQR